MAGKQEKTNAARMLDRMHIRYECIEYEVDEDDLSGTHVAAVTGLPPEMLFKTLVAKGDRTGYVVACVPVAEEIDLKALAAVSGNKSAEMIHVKELQGVTGYIRGGCSPLGMKKQFPTFFDSSVKQLSRVSVSAGRRGTQIILAPEDLIRASGAAVADIIRKKN